MHSCNGGSQGCTFRKKIYPSLRKNMDYIRWQKFLKECYFLKELLNESIMQKFFGHYGSARLMESN